MAAIKPGPSLYLSPIVCPVHARLICYLVKTGKQFPSIAAQVIAQ